MIRVILIICYYNKKKNKKKTKHTQTQQKIQKKTKKAKSKPARFSAGKKKNCKAEKQT